MPGPKAATMSPPSAGPATRAILKETEPSVIAEERSFFGTSSGIIACHAGVFIAAPMPRKNVKTRRINGDVFPEMVIRPSTSADASMSIWVNMSKRRRSIVSARAPAGRARRKKGRVVAVCTMATMKGDTVREVMSHEAPTSCIHVPTRETTLVIQSNLKNGSINGFQNDLVSVVSTSSFDSIPKFLTKTGKNHSPIR
jgi:hypothetical protein